MYGTMLSEEIENLLIITKYRPSNNCWFMKKVFLLTLVLGFISSLITAQNVLLDNMIILHGRVEEPTDSLSVYLMKFQDAKSILLDSTVVKTDCTYELTMRVEIPGLYILKCRDQWVRFWAENEDVQIDLPGRSKTGKDEIRSPIVIIRGGRNNEVINELAMLNSVINAFQNEWLSNSNILYKESKLLYKKNKEEIIDPKISEQRERMVNYLLEKYADCNSAVEILIYLKGDKLRDAISKLEKANPDNPSMAFAKERAARMEAKRMNLKPGQPAPDFTYFDNEGNEVSLHDFKGKLLVLDFWASWCGACRGEIPNLKSVYEEYKNKGVAFLSVSIDKDEKQWHQALEKEQMPWTQLITDDAGKRVMSQYEFHGIPFIVLIDADGNYLARQLRGEMLTFEIEKIL